MKAVEVSSSVVEVFEEFATLLPTFPTSIGTSLVILYVQEVVTRFICKLLHKMGHFFLDTQ